MTIHDENLLPCPFCGKMPIVSDNPKIDGDAARWINKL